MYNTRSRSRTATVHAQNRFNLFQNLHKDLRLRILQLAMNYDISHPRCIIRVNFHADPFLSTIAEDGPDAISPLLYRFSCFSPTHPDPGPLKHISRESYHEFRRINPEFLQRGSDGPRIYFNRARDVIEMDLQSLFTLSRYLLPLTKDGGWGPPFYQRFLRGFKYIQRLAIALPVPTSRGFTGMKYYLRPRLLTGLTSIRRSLRIEGTPGSPEEVRREVVQRLLDMRVLNGSVGARRRDGVVTGMAVSVGAAVMAFFWRSVGWRAEWE